MSVNFTMSEKTHTHTHTHTHAHTHTHTHNVQTNRLITCVLNPNPGSAPGILERFGHTGKGSA